MTLTNGLNFPAPRENGRKGNEMTKSVYVGKMVKSIYDFSEVEVLKADNCTEKEAKKHLEKGTTIYSPEDYLQMLKDCNLCEEMGLFNVLEIEKYCKQNKRIYDTFFTVFKSFPCVIEYVL